MSLFSELRDRAGPLAAVATRFLETHRAAPDRPELDALSDAIDRWAESDEASSLEDERFVEGAGALLGLLLLRSHGGRHVERNGVHRVQLGEHGFFDPFAAIDEALEDVDGLEHALSRAEREASAQGGVGRVLARFTSALREARPGRSVADAFGPSVVLDDGVEVDLSQVVRATEDQGGAAVDQAVEKLLRMLPGGDSVVTHFDEIEERVLPRLLSVGFLDSLGEQRARGLARRSAASGALEVSLVVRYEDRARYLRLDELAGWQMTFDDGLAVAMRNLALSSATARFARVDTEAGPLVMARTGDGLDAARLLLPSLVDVLGHELETPCVAAVPHRDVLFACADEPALVASLRARARDDAARAPHAISDRLFVVGDGPLRPVSE